VTGLWLAPMTVFVLAVALTLLALCRRRCSFGPYLVAWGCLLAALAMVLFGLLLFFSALALVIQRQLEETVMATAPLALSALVLVWAVTFSLERSPKSLRRRK